MTPLPIPGLTLNGMNVCIRKPAAKMTLSESVPVTDEDVASHVGRHQKTKPPVHWPKFDIQQHQHREILMTPKQINELHGKPVWTCVRCQTVNNLHWWNGLSVAICNSQKCNDDWNRMAVEEQERQDAYDAYVKEIYG